VLAEAIFDEGPQERHRRCNPIAIKRRIGQGRRRIVAELKRLSKPVRLDDVSEVRKRRTIASRR